MTDPKRLADGGGDALGIASLRAARRDAPPPRSKERALLAIGALGAAGATSSAATAAGTLFTLGRVLLGLAALGAISASVVVGLSSPPNEGRPVASPVGNTASPPPERAVLATPSADASAPAQPQAVHVPAPEPAPAAVARAIAATTVVMIAPAHAAAGAAPAAVARGARVSSLADEVASLELARSAIAARDPSGALRALDRHAREFPRGALGQEATMLRMEALAQKGDRPAAAELARQFVATHPASPVADRARSLARVPPEGPPERGAAPAPEP